jgi:hypothetical protein
MQGINENVEEMKDAESGNEFMLRGSLANGKVVV